MKLQDRLPESVTYNGKKIRLDLDFRNVLRMLEIMRTDNLTPEAREYLAMKCICKHPKKGMMVAVMQLLFPEKSKEQQKRIMDYEQDSELIQAAFMQEYGINLFREKLHWFEFTAFLSCMPSGNRFTDILSIRTRPMPNATKWNTEERLWLAKAKAEYGVRLSEEEQRVNYENSVKNIGRFLLTLSGEGDK